MIWSTLDTQITTAMQGTNTLLPFQNTAVNPQPDIAIDWPPLKALQSVATGQLPTIISIFDRGGSKNNTTAIVLNPVFAPQLITPGAVLTPSALSLPPGESITLTGSGSPIQGDGFCLTLASGVVQQFQLFAEYTAVPSDTLTTALTAFTTQINLFTDIVATLSMGVITVTNNTTNTFVVWSEVVNQTNVTQEGYRWLRDIQITVWSRTPADRSKYGNILEQLFTQLEVNFGFETSDQSWCRLLVKDDILHKDTQLQDIYRRDWMLSIDYPVLNVIPVFPIETIPQTYDFTE